MVSDMENDEEGQYAPFTRMISYEEWRKSMQDVISFQKKEEAFYKKKLSAARRKLEKAKKETLEYGHQLEMIFSDAIPAEEGGHYYIPDMLMEVDASEAMEMLIEESFELSRKRRKPPEDENIVVSIDDIENLISNTSRSVEKLNQIREKEQRYANNVQIYRNAIEINVETLQKVSPDGPFYFYLNEDWAPRYCIMNHAAKKAMEENLKTNPYFF